MTLNGCKIAAVPSIPFSLMYGGGETQSVKTVEALKSLGVDISFLHWEDVDKKYDLLHVFGAKYWHAPIIDLAVGRGIPVALSTISYSPPSMRLSVRSALRSAFTRIFPIPTTHKLCRQLISQADVLLPNSTAESDFLVAHFGVGREKIRVVPNAVDKAFLEGSLDIFREKYKVAGDFVLCVGKIEPRKNQLKLVESFRGWNKNLVIVGDAIDNRRDYFEKVMAIVKKSPNIRHIARLPHESGLLSSAYTAARVHVLLGVNETPGLVSLEAGLAGASLAVLDCPPVREYFLEHATYIKALSIGEIRAGITNAWGKMQDKNVLKDRILANYTWRHTAEKTLEAYRSILRV